MRGNWRSALQPLKLRWWCEARIDAMLRYSDATLEAIRRAGLTMVYVGAESGSDWVLKEMKKQLKAEQILEFAARIRKFGIIPELSFCMGNPKAPEQDTQECLAFIRKVKRLNPEAEIVVNTYTPVPQREAMYGGVEDQVQFPETPEEWATDRWQRFTTQKDPAAPWLRPPTKRLIDNFETGRHLALADHAGLQASALGALAVEAPERLALPAPFLLVPL